MILNGFAVGVPALARAGTRWSPRCATSWRRSGERLACAASLLAIVSAGRCGRGGVDDPRSHRARHRPPARSGGTPGHAAGTPPADTVEPAPPTPPPPAPVPLTDASPRAARARRHHRASASPSPATGGRSAGASWPGDFALQIVFAIFVLRIPAGQDLFRKLGEFVTTILGYCYSGQPVRLRRARQAALEPRRRVRLPDPARDHLRLRALRHHVLPRRHAARRAGLRGGHERSS